MRRIQKIRNLNAFWPCVVEAPEFELLFVKRFENTFEITWRKTRISKGIAYYIIPVSVSSPNSMSIATTTC